MRYVTLPAPVVRRALDALSDSPVGEDLDRAVVAATGLSAHEALRGRDEVAAETMTDDERALLMSYSGNPVWKGK